MKDRTIELLLVLAAFIGVMASIALVATLAGRYVGTLAVP
jgi:hypothetical protein